MNMQKELYLSMLEIWKLERNLDIIQPHKKMKPKEVN